MIKSIFQIVLCFTLLAVVSCQSRVKTTQANGLDPVEPEPRETVQSALSSSVELDRIMGQLAESARTCRDIQLEVAKGWDRIDTKTYERYRAALLLERKSCLELADAIELDPSLVDEACRLFIERVEKLDGEQARTFVALDDPDRLLRNAFGSEEVMLDYLNDGARLRDATDIYIMCIKLGLTGVQVPPVEPLN